MSFWKSSETRGRETQADPLFTFRARRMILWTKRALPPGGPMLAGIPFLLLGALTFAEAPPTEGVRLPGGSTLHEVSFERHVTPLLGKLGCNAGSCHGSFQGRGGMRLSLFGHDPDMDFLALTHDALARRVNRNDPDRSLMLLKASGQVAHGGGKRFDKNSWPYQVMRAWIAAGCPRGAGLGAVKQVTVDPAEHALLTPDQTVTLKVQVELMDGTRADVTPLCEFRSQDDATARVSAVGEVRGLQAGETPVVISYGGQLTTARVLIPVAVTKGFVYPSIPQNNYIDREVFAKLRGLNIIPSEPAKDTEFLRRVTIDTIGRLPTPAEIRAFLPDTRPNKRAVKIDELLAHLDHAALWATKFCDITACSQDSMEGPPELTAKRAKMWHDWFRRRIADNTPYDRIVRGVLCATSRDDEEITAWIRREADLAREMQKGFQTSYAERESLDLFWRRFNAEEYFPLEQMAELTATAFLGVRIECAQCHKHPFDRWTQTDYRGYANAFARVHFGNSVEVGGAIADFLARRRKEMKPKEPPIPRVREVYCAPSMQRALSDPDSKNVVAPKILGGPALPGKGDPRTEIFRWLIRPDNPYFARSFVNRVWAHYMGRGLVEPVDNFSAANPPSNERLLDALASDFVAHHYDIRRLERTILNARVYQLSARPSATNRLDKTHYSHALARPMMAEVVVDVLNGALGTTEELGPGVPPGSRAIEVALNRVQAPHLDRIFRVFGRPVRATTCDCERPHEPAIGQTLFLMTDSVLLKRMEQGRLKNLLAGKLTDREVADELFLAALSRFPDDGERRATVEHVRAAPNRRAGFTDVLWALINTREFILNH
jgi:hypothetical protein